MDGALSLEASLASIDQLLELQGMRSVSGTSLVNQTVPCGSLLAEDYHSTSSSMNSSLSGQDQQEVDSLSITFK